MYMHICTALARHAHALAHEVYGMGIDMDKDLRMHVRMLRAHHGSHPPYSTKPLVDAGVH